MGLYYIKKSHIFITCLMPKMSIKVLSYFHCCFCMYANVMVVVYILKFFLNSSSKAVYFKYSQAQFTLLLLLLKLHEDD